MERGATLVCGLCGRPAPAPVPPKPEAEPVRGVCAGIGCGKPITEHVGGECPPEPEAEGMGEERLREIEERERSKEWRLPGVIRHPTSEPLPDREKLALVAEVRRLRGEVDEIRSAYGAANRDREAYRGRIVAAESRCKALRDAVQLGRGCVATMDEDALGEGDDGESRWWIRDEVLAKLDSALAAEEGEGKA